MATKKYLYWTIPSALNGVDTLVNAGAQLSSLGDDFVDRRLCGFFSTNNTALLQFFIRSKTKKVVTLPVTGFSAQQGPLPIDYRFPKTILFDLGVTNATGGTISNIEGYLVYEVTGEPDQLA